MGRVRVCDDRCHNAKGSRCACWCGGNFHGAAGEQARADLKATVEGRMRLELYEQQGSYKAASKTIDIDFEEPQERRCA